MRPYWLAAALVALIYVPRLGAPLVYDDLPMIVQSPSLGSPIPWRTYVGPAYFRLSAGDITWRPLATLLTRSIARVAGRLPAAHRLPTLLLHLANGALVAALGLSLGVPAEAAAWGGALFLAHPAQAETLMCATYGSTALAAFFLLAMLLAHRKGRTLLAAAAFAGAMLTKEHGVLGLPLAWLMDALEERPLRRPPFAVYAAVAAAWAALRFGILAGPDLAPSLHVSFSARLALAAQAWLTAWRVLLLPFRLRLDYFAVPPASALARAGWVIAAAASALGLLSLAWKLRARRPAAWLLLWPALFLAAVSPLVPSNVLNLRLMGERFLYAPAAGVCLAAAWALRRRPAALVAILLAGVALSWSRAGAWADEPRLWEGLAQEYPWSAKAQEGLGDAWLRQGRAAEAAASFREALRLREERKDPLLAYYVPLGSELSWDTPFAHRGLALADLRLGRLDEAERELERAIALSPDAFSYRALAYLEASRGRFADAARTAGEGLAREPGDALLAKLKTDALQRRLTLRIRFF